MSSQYVTFHLVAEQCILFTVLLGMHCAHSVCMFVVCAALGHFTYARAVVADASTTSATPHIVNDAWRALAAARVTVTQALRSLFSSATWKRVPPSPLFPAPSFASWPSSSSSSSSSTAAPLLHYVSLLRTAVRELARSAARVFANQRCRVLGVVERAIHYLSPCSALPQSAVPSARTGTGTLPPASTATDVLRQTICATPPARVSVALSFVAWTLLCFGAVFVLHVPSAWKERVYQAQPTTPLRRDWYDNLRKPWYNPPPVVFPLVWILLKTLQCVMMTRRWEKLSGGHQPIRFVPLHWHSPSSSATAAASLGTWWSVATARPLHVIVFLYLLTIVIGNMWSQMFFIQLDLRGSTLILLAAAVVHTSILYVLVMRAGGDANGGVGGGGSGVTDMLDFWLYLPTVVWVCIVTVLNAHIWLLNRRRRLHEMLRREHAE